MPAPALARGPPGLCWLRPPSDPPAGSLRLEPRWGWELPDDLAGLEPTETSANTEVSEVSGAREVRDLTLAGLSLAARG